MISTPDMREITSILVAEDPSKARAKRPWAPAGSGPGWPCCAYLGLVVAEAGGFRDRIDRDWWGSIMIYSAQRPYSNIIAIAETVRDIDPQVSEPRIWFVDEPRGTECATIEGTAKRYPGVWAVQGWRHPTRERGKPSGHSFAIDTTNPDRPLVWECSLDRGLRVSGVLWEHLGRDLPPANLARYLRQFTDGIALRRLWF